MTARPAPFVLAGQEIAPGTRRMIELPVSTLSDHTPVTLSVQVVHGRRPGPVMFASAAVHGDEVIGVDIVRRLLRARPLNGLAGTLMAVPIVNTFGFLNHSRYLPDRRDLNRCFPGSPSGSLGARLAHIFLTEVVARADFGIDLHSAAIQRQNLPQIRLTAGNKRLAQMGEAFGAPVMMTSRLRDGSLRMAAEEMGVDVLLYEAGEGLRFDELAARTGVAGILRVMQAQGMIGARGVPKLRARPVVSDQSSWHRAEASGLFRAWRGIGDLVAEGETLGAISNPFGHAEIEVVSDIQGIVIGRTNMPVVNEGDALFHIAQIWRTAHAEAAMEGMEAHMEAQPLWDEDEII
ncbi:succinylglutamate desuccinylase/aspartoacylase family protein [Lutimaribacter sp. EGI FJ00015]|uniref:Succinylglutamate desuccinylase/aspartoacylase family protein n=1 Tax=Lutimaribacter degradans TaxID=2945989 RepID=A0ACC5ZUC7_9RHOB|nr:succinylglutamate desuccinylase/aspartoacylase family protein [Lutimaribacter sp. EGI FJ00013]MCM2561793.1 succinylglutamate desuccinylase/aspartoacylase family protein [Lutimaribacter sp. EGI FJ00013]MCO0613174.1 succinylglutamate desuccinylase/aspartoacylase family protein [Lutimaribacter sp. EGI FJ00015]MCO0635626.1 succinylglutamate desuccinylase/aspartoacylase family protein [Lutimaribacter sp. EGI FJ00014]